VPLLLAERVHAEGHLLMDGELLRCRLDDSRKEDSGVACHSAPTPPRTALSDFARRKPSEIPSQTQSVSAFLPGKVTMGTLFLRRITLQGHATPASKSSADKK
jgi:hypothetical protein